MVVIKSYKGGIALHLDPDENFNDLLNEIGEKFEESRKFFRDASLALSVEGRYLDTEEEKAVIQAIHDHSDVNIICLVGKNAQTAKGFIKAINRVGLQRDENNGRFYRGDVGDEEVVESEGSLVIIGNVHPGGTIAATKDIIVLGELLGDAYAGLDNNSGHFITATKFSPRVCKIGALSYNHQAGKGLFDKKKSVPYMIYERNGELIGDILGSDALIGLIGIENLNNA
ncbi:MAG: septum site-determining protein MinC [Lachnospiraceae bacterium]|nr:septum site-determining protein MinC [Lachnospiraceae bacterium]